MTWTEWYNSLAKPSWTPAPPTISLIWTVLYPVILLSFGFVFVQAGRKKLPGSVAVPFAVNLVANLLFMPIFAGLRSVPLAAADIVVVWATLVWCVVAVWPHARWVAVAQVPYFVWVSIATVLQLSITAMNR
jgi:tryptophan-rich sensory protein